MNPEVEDLFHELADLSAEQREHYFQQRGICNELRSEVEALLRFDSPPSDSLTQHVATSAEQLLDKPDDLAGLRCGPYQLLRVLGQGGMATVYLARRADGEVEQHVAVKLIRSGRSEANFRSRFLRERQILALLNHPAIAHLLDAGHAGNGQPYLAMEYVDGSPIDAYAAKLDLRGKLDLFCQVCEAVSYAHRNLVVHRDLKPSNILVDREGRPKLLDFGIAKLLDSAMGSDPERTVTLFQPLTPQYASPEQVRAETITTTTDVYSLGVVLYKLLTGRLPYEFPTFTPAAVDRTICEAEPAPPGVSRDLDNIVLMALRKEPSRRYPSVQHLSDDIQRAVTNRPISARPDTLAYRASKFIRRNRIALAAAGLALAALVTGSVVAIRQDEIAQKRFEDVRKLAHTFVFDLHDQVAKLEGSTKVREMMVATGLQYLDDLAQNSGDDLKLQEEIASGYMKIGDAQGYPTKPNLGRPADAVASYRKAGEIYKRLAAAGAVYLPDLAEYYRRFAGLVRFTSGAMQARDLSQAAIDTLDRIRALGDPGAQFPLQYAAAFCTLGDMDEDLGHYKLALQEFSHCGDLARAELHAHSSEQATSTLAQAEERIGTAAAENGFLSASQRAFDEDEELLARLIALQPLDPELHRREALLHQFRAELYYEERYPNFDDPRRSLESARRYLASAASMVASDPNNTSAKFSKAIATYTVSFALTAIDPAEAVAMARESVRMFDQMKASNPSYLVVSRRAIALYHLAAAYYRAGDTGEAWRTSQSALAQERAVSSQGAKNMEEQIQLVESLILAGKIGAKLGMWQRAEGFLREARDRAGSIARSEELTRQIPLANAEEALAGYYARRHRRAEERAHYQKIAEIWQRYPASNEYAALQRAKAAKLLASTPN